MSEHQKSHPPEVLKDDLHVSRREFPCFYRFIARVFQKELRRMQSLPLKGPTPIWLVCLICKILFPFSLEHFRSLVESKISCSIVSLLR